MNICRYRLWTLAVRLARPLDELPAQSIRMNSVIARNWHSVATAHTQKSIDVNRWPQWSTARINEPFVMHMSASRNVHSHKRDIKYEEKNDEKEVRSEASAPDARKVEQQAKAAPKIPSEPEVAESPPAPPPTSASANDLNAIDPEKLGLFARFKLMSKQYWYVLLPVHLVTSCFWFGGFYYLSTSGVDIPTLLESLSVSETIVAKLRDSTMGHLAIAYMCYKIVTPIRYTVTLGGTTLSIKYLSRWGYIRPMPSKEKLKQMYQDQKAKFKQKD